MIRCSNCGEINEEGAARCEGCGAALAPLNPRGTMMGLPRVAPLTPPEAPREEDEEGEGRMPGSGTERGMRRGEIWSGIPTPNEARPYEAGPYEAGPSEPSVRSTRFGLPSLQRPEGRRGESGSGLHRLPPAEGRGGEGTQFGLPAIRRGVEEERSSPARPVREERGSSPQTTLVPGRPFAAFDPGGGDEPRRTHFGIPAPRLGGDEEPSGEVRSGPQAPRRGSDQVPARSTSAGFQRIDPVAAQTGRLTLPVPRLGEPEPLEAPQRREDSGLFKMPSKQTLEIRAPMARNTMMGMRALDEANQRRTNPGRYMLHGVAIDPSAEEEAAPEPPPTRKTTLHMGALRLDPLKDAAPEPPPAKPAGPPSTPSFAIPAPRESGTFGALDVDGGWGEGGLGELFGDDFDAALQTALEDSMEAPSVDGAASLDLGLSRSAVEARGGSASGIYRAARARRAGESSGAYAALQRPRDAEPGQKAPGSGIYSTRRPRAPEAPLDPGLATSASSAGPSPSAAARAARVPSSGMMRAVVRPPRAEAAAPEVPDVLEITQSASSAPFMEHAPSTAPGSGILKAPRRRRPEEEPAPPVEAPALHAAPPSPSSSSLRAPVRPVAPPVQLQAPPTPEAALFVGPPLSDSLANIVLPTDAPPREAAPEEEAPAAPLSLPVAAPASPEPLRAWARGAAFASGFAALLAPLVPGRAGWIWERAEEVGSLGVLAGLFPLLLGALLVLFGVLPLPGRVRAAGVGVLGCVLAVISALSAGDATAGLTTSLWGIGLMGLALPLGLFWHAGAGSAASRVGIVIGLLGLASVYAFAQVGPDLSVLGWALERSADAPLAAGILLLPLALALASLAPLALERARGLGAPIGAAFALWALLAGPALGIASAGDAGGGATLGLLGCALVLSVGAGLGALLSGLDKPGAA